MNSHDLFPYSDAIVNNTTVCELIIANEVVWRKPDPVKNLPIESWFGAWWSEQNSEWVVILGEELLEAEISKVRGNTWYVAIEEEEGLIEYYWTHYGDTSEVKLYIAGVLVVFLHLTRTAPDVGPPVILGGALTANPNTIALSLDRLLVTCSLEYQVSTSTDFSGAEIQGNTGPSQYLQVSLSSYAQNYVRVRYAKLPDRWSQPFPVALKRPTPSAISITNLSPYGFRASSTLPASSTLLWASNPATIPTIVNSTSADFSTSPGTTYSVGVTAHPSGTIGMKHVGGASVDLSSDTRTASVVTPIIIPGTPTGLSATSLGSLATCSWNGTENTNSYIVRLYRATGTYQVSRRNLFTNPDFGSSDGITAFGQCTWSRDASWSSSGEGRQSLKVQYSGSGATDAAARVAFDHQPGRTYRMRAKARILTPMSNISPSNSHQNKAIMAVCLNSSGGEMDPGHTLVSVVPNEAGVWDYEVRWTVPSNSRAGGNLRFYPMLPNATGGASQPMWWDSVIIEDITSGTPTDTYFFDGSSAPLVTEAQAMRFRKEPAGTSVAEYQTMSSEDLNNLSNLELSVNVNPASIYGFRVQGVNTMATGGWSEFYWFMTPEGPNLITNGQDFANTSGWVGANCTLSTWTASIPSPVSSRVLVIAVSGSSNDTHASTTVVTTPGRRYRASGWLQRPNSMTNSSINAKARRMEIIDGSTSHLSPQTPNTQSNTWHYHEIEFTATNSSVTVRLWNGHRSGGTVNVHWDGIQVREIG